MMMMMMMMMMMRTQTSNIHWKPLHRRPCSDFMDMFRALSSSSSYSFIKQQTGRCCANRNERCEI